MKIISTMAARPLAWLTLLGVVVLFLPAFTLSYWCISNTKTEDQITMDQHQTRVKLVNDIQHTTKVFATNESSIGLARLLDATLRGNEVSSSILQTKVASILFQAFSTLPSLAQISFIGINGLSFSFSASGEKITAIYTNETSVSRNHSSPIHKYYTQPVSDAGELIGDPRAKPPPLAGLNSTTLLSALNSTIYASVGAPLSGGSELLFLNTVPIDRSIGVVSLGFPVKAFSDFFAERDLHGAGLYVATKDGAIVTAQGVLSDGDYRNFPDSGSPFFREISGEMYELYYSTISLAGVPSVYIVAFPYNGLLKMIHEHSRNVLILLVMTLVAMAAFVASFMFLTVKSTREKMRLNAQLIEQMEITRQAERKSSNKSMAIATASHDVRAALSGIVGLIDICYYEVTSSSESNESHSELKQSLQQMSSCANDLLALLNSILDTSKIEAGKMQLQKTEFNLTQLLEDLADLYHPVGMKKGVEVVLDPCDSSVYTFSNVRGDSGKVKQILSNLLSNAVKFTKEGHISIRVWARKFSFENSVVEDPCGRSTTCCASLCFFQKKVKSDASDLQDSTKMIKRDTNCIEFVFEVDDTGVGIPKEKYKTVFENYEQVKDVAAEVGGTGLGLGIVRSLVQLMGGDIKIMDKSPYKGTCFRFNIFLLASDDQMKTFPWHNNICNDNIGSSGRAMTPPTPNNFDGSLVVLLIQNKGRRKMIHNFLETQGLRVMVAKQARFLPSILKEVKSKINGSSFCSSADLSPRSCFSSSSSARREDSRYVPLTALEGVNETVSISQRRPNFLGINCVLLIIDANAGDFVTLSKRISDFQKDVSKSTCCKVVWLDRPETRNLHFQQNNFAPTDDIFIKPLHGSRLFQVIGNLPKFGGQLPKHSPKRKRSNTMEVGSVLDPDTSDQKSKSKISSAISATYQGEIEEIGSSSSERSLVRRRSSISSLTADKGPIVSSIASKKIETDLAEPRSNVAGASSSSSQKPLFGKKILIVEDNEVQKRISAKNVSRMGASSVETCKNGKEALDLVCKSLSDQSLSGSLELPYHCILMDCQMPEMDGFEATRRIRDEEAKYGVHIPIFALTAHDSGEILERMFEAGMDAHLERPLKEDQLVEAMRSLKSQNDG